MPDIDNTRAAERRQYSAEYGNGSGSSNLARGKTTPASSVRTPLFRFLNVPYQLPRSTPTSSTRFPFCSTRSTFIRRISVKEHSLALQVCLLLQIALIQTDSLHNVSKAHTILIEAISQQVFSFFSLSMMLFHVVTTGYLFL